MRNKMMKKKQNKKKQTEISHRDEMGKKILIGQ